MTPLHGLFDQKTLECPSDMETSCLTGYLFLDAEVSLKGTVYCICLFYFQEYNTYIYVIYSSCFQEYNTYIYVIYSSCFQEYNTYIYVIYSSCFQEYNTYIYVIYSSCFSGIQYVHICDLFIMFFRNTIRTYM